MRLRFPIIKIDKAYLIEATVIVFSVLMALFLNEIRNNRIKKRQTRQILHNIREEIIRNQQVVKSMVVYHNSVINNTSSVMQNDSVCNQLIDKSGFNFF